MRIEQQPVGMVEANCYLVISEENHAAIVDPGGDADFLIEWMKRLSVTPKMILLTHGHFDHIAAVWDLLDHVDLPVYIHTEDGEMLLDVQKALCGMVPLYFHFEPNLAFVALQDGDTVSLDELTIHTIHTPGHTKGSVCYQVEDCLLTGDTLFAGSIGRTDLPGGSIRVLKQSLEKLIALTENYHVLSGHGNPSSLAVEKTQNVYLATFS